MNVTMPPRISAVSVDTTRRQLEEVVEAAHAGTAAVRSHVEP